MEKLPLISVIIPIYKVEAYLDKCISSIVNQTYTNLEIILVDDGSPDNCPVICEKWAEKDCRIKVVHKANGGSAQARNVGLNMATGDYIAFADSDDIMNCDMLRTLYNVTISQKADIVECEYSIDKNEVLKQALDATSIDVYDPQMAMMEHINDKIFKQVIWNKLYKTETIEGVRFVEGKIIDDEFWTYRAIGNATKLVHIQDKLYFYRQQDGSIMHQCYSLKRLASVEAHIERHNYLCDKFPELCEQSLVRLWFDCRYHGQMALLKLNGKEKKEAFDYLHNVINTFPLPCSVVLHQEPKEKIWLMIEKLSLKLVCQLRNVLRKGL